MGSREAEKQRSREEKKKRRYTERQEVERDKANIHVGLLTRGH